MNNYFLGCDVSKGYGDFMLLNSCKTRIESGFQLDDTTEGHKKLCNFLDLFYKDHKDALIYAGLESTGGYENNWLALFKRLSEAYSLKVTRVDPLAVKRYREACKKRIITDAVSAHVIAHYLSAFHQELNFEQDFEFGAMRRQWNLTQLLIKQKTQLDNQLSFHLYQSNPELVKYCKDGIPRWVLLLLSKYPTAQQLARVKVAALAKIPYVTSQRAAELIEKAKSGVASCTTSVDAMIIKTITEQLLNLESTIAEQKKMIINNTKTTEINLLASIPGIGDYSAAGLIATIVTIKRFTNTKKLAAFLGLHPIFKESGDGRTVSRMSKHGHSQPRALLYMAVLSALSCNPVIKKTYETCIEKKMAPMAAIGVCMHKFARIIYGILASGKPFDPQIDQMYQKRSKKLKKTVCENKRRLQPYDLDAPVSKKQNQNRRNAKECKVKERESKPQRNSIPACEVIAPLSGTKSKNKQSRIARENSTTHISTIINTLVEV